ncbi:PucR family transcriptional regulator [Streptomyces sp. WAC04114]|uniref:helix-turn-helix domain-containing protein n=1 Tax=Streptomyces sp. WAC04114 TaxID=2867961 RepID=UPI001C8C4E94|nr:PucR family transcriptional regulator [Streptomyces sp. WAC04114]MBX9361913.1 helix-turn-helix domain-containing protein [Streptomyces sp. WAC04114]
MTESGEASGRGAGAADEGTLERLLSVVGVGAVELHTAPRGLRTQVSGVHVLDALEPVIRPRELLLAIGVDRGSAHAVDVVRRAGEAGAAGVVFGPGRPEPTARALQTAAEESGTAVLFRTAWCTWAQLVGVLRAGLAAAGTPPMPATSGVPLGDLDALADAVATLVGGSVTIEDTESRVLAYSSTEENVDEMRRLTILGRRVPPWRVAAMREAGFFQALWGAGDVLHRPAHGQDPERLVGAVLAGGEALGSIWVAAVAGRPLSPNAAETLRAAARTAAAHLLHHRTHSSDGRLVEDAARALLEDRGSVEVLAQRASLPPREPCAVLAVGTGPGRSADDGPSGLYGLLTLHCAALGHRVVVVPAAGGTLVLLGGLERAAERAEGQVRRLGNALADQLSGATGAAVKVGLGDVVPGLAGAPASRRSAERALRALIAAAGPHTVARCEDVADTVGILQVVDALREVTLPPRTSVARLREFDAEHGGSCLVETLRAYLDHFGDVSAASRALGVHANSLRYRLRRIRQVSGLDLESPDARLLAQVQLRLGGEADGVRP